MFTVNFSGILLGCQLVLPKKNTPRNYEDVGKRRKKRNGALISNDGPLLLPMVPIP